MSSLATCAVPAGNGGSRESPCWLLPAAARAITFFCLRFACKRVLTLSWSRAPSLFLQPFSFENQLGKAFVAACGLLCFFGSCLLHRGEAVDGSVYLAVDLATGRASRRGGAASNQPRSKNRNRIRRLLSLICIRVRACVCRIQFPRMLLRLSLYFVLACNGSLCSFCRTLTSIWCLLSCSLIVVVGGGWGVRLCSH